MASGRGKGGKPSKRPIERYEHKGKKRINNPVPRQRSTCEINKMQRGFVTCYMGPAGAVMGQTRFSVGTNDFKAATRMSFLTTRDLNIFTGQI